MLIPYGEHNPPPAIDPADYPHRILIAGSNPTGATAIMWLDSCDATAALDDVEVFTGLLATNGALLVMAREADVLARATASLRASILWAVA